MLSRRHFLLLFLFLRLVSSSDGLNGIAHVGQENVIAEGVQVAPTTQSSGKDEITLLRAEAEEAFELFVGEHKKSYLSSMERAYRADIFAANYRRIKEHNNDSSQSWKMGVNRFSDLSWEEFSPTVLMADQKCSATTPTGFIPSTPMSLYPPWLDWRTYGIVSPVKDQGSCGSCWTFSTTGALEAHTALAYMRAHRNQLKPHLTLFSEQQLIDCANNFNNNGCDGGLPSRAFEYIQWQGGLDTEQEYPYIDGGPGHHPAHTCHYRNTTDKGKAMGGSFNIPERDEAALLSALVAAGPISIAYDVTPDFQHYKSGVYSSNNCRSGEREVNHAVLLVGYGVDSSTGMSYWTVKNSWSVDFGENGYFRIQRGVNMCGLADCAAYPLLIDGKQVEARGGYEDSQFEEV
eukprot:GHVS01040366.1.p1 GENE.GHVS01040366.1~~GHVS01040366.1.p1  ORF type:complete len:404 (-),score=62.12 GHVS01040366.1:209-1420(-)